MRDSGLKQLFTWAIGAFAFFASLVPGTAQHVALRQRLDLVAVMITVIIAGVVGYVGINIMSNTSDTAGLGDYTTDTVNNTQWENTTLELHNGLESFFSQIGTVFIVIVLVVVIGYLMLLRGR